MDRRPVGVFDSGLGGLTAIRELRRVLPNEDIIYFGDTGRVPYGTRSAETIIKYARQDIRFLKSFDIKAILIACGTVSSLLEHFVDDIDIPCIGVVDPTAKAASALTKNRRVGVIGTTATISSRSYEKAIMAADPRIETMSRGCPLFVPLVENGRFLPGDVVIETVTREYLEPFPLFGCDSLILGCTHYPLLKDVISAVLPGVHLLDPGLESSHTLKQILTENNMLSDGKTGKISYYVSDDPSNFASLGSVFLGGTASLSVNKVDIDKF